MGKNQVGKKGEVGQVFVNNRLIGRMPRAKAITAALEQSGTNLPPVVVWAPLASILSTPQVLFRAGARRVSGAWVPKGLENRTAFEVARELGDVAKSPADLARALGRKTERVRAVLRELERAGLVTLVEDGWRA